MGPGLRRHLDYMQHVACLEVMLGKPFLKSSRLVSLTFRRRVILLRLLLFYYALSTLATKTCDESKVKSKTLPSPLHPKTQHKDSSRVQQLGQKILETEGLAV